jgi:hypothetical protein
LPIFLVPILELQHALFTLEMLLIKEHTLTLSPSVVFTFGLTVESIKELGGASTILHFMAHLIQEGK